MCSNVPWSRIWLYQSRNQLILTVNLLNFQIGGLMKIWRMSFLSSITSDYFFCQLLITPVRIWYSVSNHPFNSFNDKTWLAFFSENISCLKNVEWGFARSFFNSYIIIKRLYCNSTFHTPTFLMVLLLQVLGNGKFDYNFNAKRQKNHMMNCA